MISFLAYLTASSSWLRLRCIKFNLISSFSSLRWSYFFYRLQRYTVSSSVLSFSVLEVRMTLCKVYISLRFSSILCELARCSLAFFSDATSPVKACKLWFNLYVWLVISCISCLKMLFYCFNRRLSDSICRYLFCLIVFFSFYRLFLA